MTASHDSVTPKPGQVIGRMNYLSPESKINRRYFGPGFEINTNICEFREMPVQNGRLADPPLSLDINGFTLVNRQSALDLRSVVADIDGSNLENGPSLKDHPYAIEVRDIVKRLSGADLVLNLNCIARTAGADVGTLQPPAGDVHVDMAKLDAQRNARRTLDLHGMSGRPFSRFLCTSFWRPISAPPQDVPLALCDYQSVDDDEGEHNFFVLADTPPELNNLPETLEGWEDRPHGYIFRYNPKHRWYYFPDMTPDEAILLKLHDSDHNRAWRAPHTAFSDPSVAAAHPRESIEFRTIAYFD